MDKSQSHGTPSWTAGPLKHLAKAAASEPLSSILDALAPHGDTYIVGGSVRDILIGNQATDFDLACSLEPHQTSAILRDKNIKVVETGLKHGTITAVIDTLHIEITTLRRGFPHHMEFSHSIEEDLSARDFTINAVAFDPKTKTLIDPSGGLADLKQGILRAVGDPSHRFQEDPLRILRMIRFGPADGRSIEASTVKAARNHASSLEKVSVERIQHELRKIVVSPHAAAAIRAMLEIDILALILPELMPSVGFEQNQFHNQDVFEHTLTVLSAAPATLTLRLAALFHDVGKPHTLSVGEDGARHFYLHEKVSTELCVQAMKRLKFSHDEIATVSLIVRHHMRPLECGPPGLRRIMRDLGPHFDEWRQMKIADAPPVMETQEFEARLANFDSMVDAEKARLEKAERTLAVNGDDLIALGFSPGVLLGRALKHLEELVLDDPDVNKRELLLQHAQSLLNKQTEGDL